MGGDCSTYGWVYGLVGEWMGGVSRGGASAKNFARFSEKLHEIKKILVQGGGMCRGAPPWIRHWSGKIIQNQINLDFFPGHFYLNHFSPLQGYFWVTHPDQQAEVNSLSYTLK